PRGRTHEERADVGQGGEARADPEIVPQMGAQPDLFGEQRMALRAGSDRHFGSHTRMPSSRYSLSVVRSLSLGSVASRSRKMSAASGSPTKLASTARP